MEALKFRSALRALGIFRVIYASAVQLNGTVFRIIVGILSGARPDALAILAGVESFLSILLEVPGGYFADRLGKAVSSLMGLGLISAAMLSIYFACSPDISGTASLALIVLTAVFLGIGRPLFSGAIEAFYQAELDHLSQNNPELKLQAERSFVVSARFGKFLPPLIVGAGFALAYFLNEKGVSQHALLFGVFLWFYLVIQLWRDKRRFDHREVLSKQASWKEHAGACWKILKANRLAQLALALTTLNFLMISIIAGYQVLSWNASFKTEAAEVSWSVLISFVAGQMSLGWFLRATLLPWLLARLNESKAIKLLFSLSLIFNGLYFLLLKLEVLDSGMGWGGLALVFFYATSFQFIHIGMASLATNLALKAFPPQYAAMGLSMINLPGFLADVIYSIYLVQYRAGFPSLSESFLSLALLACVGYFCTELYSCKRERSYS